MKVYLDNSATTMVAAEVMKAMEAYFSHQFGNPSSLHRWGIEAREAVELARKKIAASLNAAPSEIIFTSGGTEANNLALKGIGFSNKNKQIIVSSVEHDSVLKAALWMGRMGWQVAVLPTDSKGYVDPDKLENAITKDTVLVSIIHGNNELGTINPISSYASVCQKHGVLFHTDACQSYTKVPIDVKKLGLDLLTINAHKIHGPKGIGALFIRKGTPVTALMHGGGHELAFRSGTENVPGIVGFGEAAGLTTKTDVEKMIFLRDMLIDGLLEIKGGKLNGPRERLCNHASITFRGIEGDALLLKLNRQGIAVSTGSACASHNRKPSHVLLAVGLTDQEAKSTIRFTLSRYTTREEIDITIRRVKECITKSS